VNLKAGAKVIVLLAIGALVGSVTTLFYLQFWSIDVKDAVLLLIGAIIGLISTYWFFYSQFSKGNGGRRMMTINEATHKFNTEFKKRKEEQNIGALRNEYRYGLAVIIDELEQLDNRGFKPDGTLPTLIDCGIDENGVDQGADRWDRFNLYIRPVVDDINAYALLRTLSSRVFQPIRQLARLVDLCNQLEIVVMHLDAVFAEKSEIVEWQKFGGKAGYQLVLKDGLNDDRTKLLTDELKNLSVCWKAWKDAIGIKEGQN
jgi:hypothetical protein